jgi:hypothetical protein
VYHRIRDWSSDVCSSDLASRLRNFKALDIDIPRIKIYLTAPTLERAAGYDTCYFHYNNRLFGVSG